MKKSVLLILPFFLFVIGGCTGNTHDADLTYGGLNENEFATEQIVQLNGIERFKLFPTQNMWTFIKLDTQTGKIWQVQYSVSGEDLRFECCLNPNQLVPDGKKMNGRFDLYPTQNRYNFILLDRIDGKTWQVQWSFDEENRVIVPIDSAVSSN